MPKSSLYSLHLQTAALTPFFNGNGISPFSPLLLEFPLLPHSNRLEGSIVGNSVDGNIKIIHVSESTSRKVSLCSKYKTSKMERFPLTILRQVPSGCLSRRRTHVLSFENDSQSLFPKLSYSKMVTLFLRFLKDFWNLKYKFPVRICACVFRGK